MEIDMNWVIDEEMKKAHDVTLADSIDLFSA